VANSLYYLHILLLEHNIISFSKLISYSSLTKHSFYIKNYLIVDESLFLILFNSIANSSSSYYRLFIVKFSYNIF